MSRPIPRRRLVIAPAAAGLLGALGTGAARADGYPSKAIRMVVPFPAGGPTDIVARPLAQLLGDRLGQQVYIDNRGGAGGSIGADFVAKAANDGYTLLMGTVGTSAINGTLYKNLPHDPVADFTPVATVASAPVAIVVHPDSGITSLQDLLAKARARPNEIGFGSAGNGTPGHLTGAMFCSAAGIRLRHIPYKGSAPAVRDLLGNQIPLMFDPLQSVLPHIQGGKLRALAVTSRERAKVVPQVPTVDEAALKGFESTAWWAVFGPAKLPAEVTSLLRKEIERVVHSPDFEGKLGDLGVQPMTRPLAEFQKSEAAKWGAAVRETGVSID